MWLARVPLPDCPVYAVHQVLWGYYDLAPGEPRPFLYRVAGDGIDLLSRLKPRCPAREIRLESGRVYQFEALLSPVKGDTHGEGRKYWDIRGNDERRAWLVRRFEGADLTFCQAFDRPTLRFVRPGGEKVTVPRCVMRGTVYVRDRAAFTEAVLRGPGKGKAWGCGLVWLPEVMGG